MTTATEGSPHSAFEFPYIVSDNQLKTSALLNFALGAVSLLLFITFRGTLRSVGGVYQRRRELQDLFLQPHQLLLGGLQQAWSWVTVVMCMSDADIARTAGFDALLLNRTILMGLQIFSVLTLLSLGILLPTYYSFDDVVTHRLHRGTNVAELSRTTISNLPPGHAILWLPTAAAYLVTAYCCWVLLVHCQSYAELRMAYMLCLDAAGRQPYQERKPRCALRPVAGGGWGAPRWGSGSLEAGAGTATAATPLAGPCHTLSAQPSAASLQKLLPGGSTCDTPRNVSRAGDSPGPTWSLWNPPAHLNPHNPQHAHLLLQVQQLAACRGGRPAHMRQVSAESGLHPSASTYSLQEAAAATAAGEPCEVPVVAVHRVAGLARMSYDPTATATSVPAATSALSISSLRPELGTPLAPLGSGAMPLRLRLRLVAPWLRHVVVTAAERAAQHKAADNLLAWVDPLRMLAKDREDWARQQLAADDDPDPSLPPIPSGQPPPTTACHAGLLVASEDLLMGLTGRGEDLADPWVRAGGLGARIDWGENVAALARSLGIWLRREGGQGAVVAGGTAKAAGGVEAETNAEAGDRAAAVLGPQGDERDAGPATRDATAASRGANTGGCRVLDTPGLGPLTPADDLGPDSGSSRAVPVYRFWAPEAEQRCWCRNLQRRQRRQAATAAAAAEPGTPLGFDSVRNPIFDQFAASFAAASAGGSTTDGGAALSGTSAATFQRGYASVGPLSEETAAAAAVADGSRRAALHRLDDGGYKSGAGMSGSAFSSGGGGAVGQAAGGCSWRSPRAATCGDPAALGPVGRGAGAGRSGDGAGLSAEQDDASDVEAERPWTGWQQQPLVVGRCNARLRQLMKVRHGGRSHLVNTHHYAVLIRDVVLHPGEHRNALGLPALRFPAEETAGRWEPRGPGRDPRDVEWGGGYRSGGGALAGRAAAAAFAAQRGSFPIDEHKSGGDRAGEEQAVAASKAGVRGTGEGRKGGEGAGHGAARDSSGRMGGGSEGSSSAGGEWGLGDGGGGGRGGSGPEDQADGEGNEQDPLLSSSSDRDRDGAADGGSDGDSAARPSRPGSEQQQRRRRPPRPLLQPASDLPLRDRAILLVRELRPRRAGERRQGPGASPGGALRRGSGGEGLGLTGAAVEAANGDDDAPLLAPCRPPAGTDPAGAGPGEQQLGTAGRTWGFSGMGSGTSSRECSACSLPRPPQLLLGANGQQQPVWAAAASGGKAGMGLGMWSSAAAGSAACLGPAPAPPPLMELPYDDSEEAAAVAAYYSQLFPDSFQRLVPVCNHRAVDELLFQWTAARDNLAAALLAAQVAVRSASPSSPQLTTPGTVPGTAASTLPSPRVSSRSHSRAAKVTSQPPAPPLAVEPVELPPPDSLYSAAVRRTALAVRRLQDRIAAERARALRCPTRRAYVALFTSQRDAAAAAQCSPLAPPSRAQPLHFRACAAPPPDSVYWPALWTLPRGRAARLLLSAPLLAVLVFPVGALTGALANLPVAVCGGNSELNALYWPWFCNRQNSHSLSSRLAKSLLTGLLPALISLGWNAWVLPMVLYLLSAVQSRCVSLPAMDRQMSRWFFRWSLLNMFVGAVVGGGIFQQLGAYLQDPGKLLLRIGTALPTTSNFFMHYTLTKGLYSNWLRVAWPHLGAMAGAILRGVGGAALPRSWQDVSQMHSPPGYRFSSFYNGVFQTLMVGLAYVVTAPLIAPIALLFFVTAYLTWRYAIVYVYERQYESGGQMFPLVFQHMTGSLLVAELFTGAVLLTNGAWIQAALLWCSLTPLILAFRRLCERRYLQPLEHPPMSLAMAAPPASVDASVYLPPALREGSVGWYPESGKVWEQYGIPKYVI